MANCTFYRCVLRHGQHPIIHSLRVKRSNNNLTKIPTLSKYVRIFYEIASQDFLIFVKNTELTYSIDSWSISTEVSRL